ncbi:CCHC-type domain-containing protein [Trichonephila inaurata madagascariensis]|uniref:CCHC-type domain-containing protein n=1 Tax=Trichonephila inaurata madagascariensis TaxID=2747483 RepID=A0A8X6YQA0_9ARAC|nr:CCHC-type domain-containing protein [Trichonephila inaurata madagascariensis]
MAFLIRSRKIDLIQLARDLDESPDPSMSKIVLKDLITSSKYYKEEEAKELLEVITAERLETEQQQKLEQQEQLSIEKLHLEIELSRNANQSATQNNGQTSRVKSLDEIVKMVRLLTVKGYPINQTGGTISFLVLKKAFASENVSDELKPKVLLCMLGDKVSNLLVNLGEEELKDYESLKQVVLKEYEPSPKICLENFRKAKRNPDETFSQFASRLTSMWLYYWKSYDGPARAKWNDNEKGSFNGNWGKQPFGEKRSDNNFSSDKSKVPEIKKFACFTCGSDKHLKRDCPKNKGLDNKGLNVNKVSTEGTELEDGTVAARVDLLGKVIPRRAIEDKLSKLVKTSISVNGKLVHALVDSGMEITVIKKDLVPGISVESASTIYLKGIFGPAVKCPLVYVPIGLATGGQINVVHQQVLCALAEVLVEDVLLPPDVLDMLGGAHSEENSLAQSSQDLRVDSGNVDETEVSSGILPEKAQENVDDGQRNITSCRNEVGTFGTKDEEVTAEMDKGSMVAVSFRSEQECCAELALAWKHAKEGKGNYYELCTTPVFKYLEDLKCKLEKAAEQAKLVSTVQQEKMAYYHNLRSSDRVFKVGEKVIVLVPDSTSGACKDLLLAPGNRSKDTNDFWLRAHYIRKDLATTGGDQSGRDRTKERRRAVGRKTWSEGGKTAGRWIVIFYHLDIFFFL